MRPIETMMVEGERAKRMWAEQSDDYAALEAKLTIAREALMKCQEEIDEYISSEFPLDHTVHEQYRQRGFAANPARQALALIDRPEKERDRGKMVKPKPGAPAGGYPKKEQDDE